MSIEDTTIGLAIAGIAYAGIEALAPNMPAIQVIELMPASEPVFHADDIVVGTDHPREGTVAEAPAELTGG